MGWEEEDPLRPEESELSAMDIFSHSVSLFTSACSSSLVRVHFHSQLHFQFSRSLFSGRVECERLRNHESSSFNSLTDYSTTRKRERERWPKTEGGILQAARDVREGGN